MRERERELEMRNARLSEGMWVIPCTALLVSKNRLAQEGLMLGDTEAQHKKESSVWLKS